MDIISDFLDRMHAERGEGGKRPGGTRAPFAVPGAGGSDARDERQVTPIRRADGRVVESIVLHSLWP